MAGKFGETTEGRLERIELQLDSIELALKTYISNYEEAERRLEVLLNTLQTEEIKIMAEIDDLVAAVNEVKTVEDGGVLAINTLIDRVNALVQNATDLTALKAAVAAEAVSVRANAVPLADAIANVPPAP